MTTYRAIKQQLEQRGLKVPRLGVPEIRQLRRLLRENELLVGCLTGYYHAGSAVLVVTSQRLLIIDKRIFFVNIEEIRYHKIRNVDFNHGTLTSSIKFYMRKDYVIFRSFHKEDLEKLHLLLREQLFVVPVSQVTEDSVDRTLIRPKDIKQTFVEWSGQQALLPRRRFAKYRA